MSIWAGNTMGKEVAKNFFFFLQVSLDFFKRKGIIKTEIIPIIV